MKPPDVGWLARGNRVGWGFCFRIDQGVGAAGLGAAADPQAQGEGGGQVVAGEPVPVREIPESAAGQRLDDR